MNIDGLPTLHPEVVTTATEQSRSTELPRQRSQPQPQVQQQQTKQQTQQPTKQRKFEFPYHLSPITSSITFGFVLIGSTMRSQGYEEWFGTVIAIVAIALPLFVRNPKNSTIILVGIAIAEPVIHALKWLFN